MNNDLFCDDCCFLSPTEAEQDVIKGMKGIHVCNKYSKQVRHHANNGVNFHPHILRLYPCIKDKSKAFLPAPVENVDNIVVKVRWNDGYFERFKAAEARAGSDLLWIKLKNGETRHIPLRQVRWFSGLY